MPHIGTNSSGTRTREGWGRAFYFEDFGHIHDHEFTFCHQEVATLPGGCSRKREVLCPRRLAIRDSCPLLRIYFGGFLKSPSTQRVTVGDVSDLLDMRSIVLLTAGNMQDTDSPREKRPSPVPDAPLHTAVGSLPLAPHWVMLHLQFCTMLFFTPKTRLFRAL